MSNEEILSINEELRSANEELETSKEELQALNEQLSQMNSQLEHKIHQLEALTEDVTNLLASTAISTVLIDQHSLIKRFTPSATRMFGLALPDVGRTIADVLGTPLGDALMRDIEGVLSGVTEHAERKVETATGQWYVRRVTPYITESCPTRYERSNRPAAANRAEETMGGFVVAKWSAVPLKTD